MDANIKKKLLLVFDYLKLNGCHYAEKEGDFHIMSFYDQNSQWYCVSQKSRNLVRIPLDIIDDIEKLIDDNQKDFDGFGEDPYGFEARLYPDTKKISIFELYSEYLTEDTKTVIVDSEEEPEVKEIIDHYCKKEEICRGNITFQFHGGGDSGYIEDGGNSDFDGETKLYEQAEDMFFRMLGDFPGWEINEGSQGQCIIDMDLEQMQLDFNENYEEQKVDEIWSTSLMEGINEDLEKVPTTPGNVDDENEDLILSSVKKLLQTLYFDGLDVSYDLYRIPNRDKDYISLDIDVDVSRIVYSHENYDERYADVVYDLENVFDTVEKYLGLSNQIYVGINYSNNDFLDEESYQATKELHEALIKSGVFTTEQANDTWISAYYREDDYPFISVESGGPDIPDEGVNLFQNTVWNIIEKYKHLSMLVNDNDIEWWTNY